MTADDALTAIARLFAQAVEDGDWHAADVWIEAATRVSEQAKGVDR